MSFFCITPFEGFLQISKETKDFKMINDKKNPIVPEIEISTTSPILLQPSWFFKNIKQVQNLSRSHHEFRLQNGKGLVGLKKKYILDNFVAKSREETALNSYIILRAKLSWKARSSLIS